MKYTGRHTDAFLLLFLMEGDCYGGQLLKKCEDDLPSNPIDSAILYRTLRKLEDEGAIQSYTDVSATDRPKKMYTMTALGEERLAVFKEDIEEKMRNLTFFLDTYEERTAKRHD